MSGMTVEEAAAEFPIGSKVEYFSILPSVNYVTATVRSEPWMLGHGAVVVKVTGRAGGVSVEHLRRAALGALP